MKKLTKQQLRRLVYIAGATVEDIERSQSRAAQSLARLSRELRNKRATLAATINAASRAGAL